MIRQARFFAAVLVVMAAGGSRAADVTLLYTGDTYGFLGAKGFAGGFPKLKAAVTKIRGAKANVVLLDSGNALAQHYSSRFDRGELAAGLMSDLGYQGFNPGFHDFDYGQTRIVELARKFSLPMVSSNTIRADGTSFVSPELRLIVGGVRVGILGVIDPDTARKTISGQFAGLKATDPAEALRAGVARLRPDVDLLVVLANLGYYESARLAKEVGGLDIVISRSKSSAGEYEVNQKTSPFEFTEIFSSADPSRKTLVATPSRYGHHLGRIDVTIPQKGRGWSFAPSVVDLGVDYPEDPAVAERVAHHDRAVEQAYGKVLIPDVRKEFGGPLTKELFSDILLSSMRDENHSEVAVINETAFSKLDYTFEMVSGRNQLLEEDLRRVFWTENHLVKGTYTGAEIEAIVKEGEGLLWYKGLKQKNGTIEINGRPLVKTQEYTIATSNYLVSEDSAVPALKSGKYIHSVKERPSVLRDEMIQRLSKGEPPVHEPEYRPQWSLNFDQVTVSISNFDARNNTSFPAVRDARVQSTDVFGVAAGGRIELKYDREELAWINTVVARYTRLELDNNVISNPEDLFQSSSQIDMKDWGMSVAGRNILVPFLHAAFETEFTSAGGNPRAKDLLVTPGLTTTWNNRFLEMRIGPTWKTDFSLPKSNFAVGPTFLYRLAWPLPKGISFRSELDFRYFPWYREDRADTLLVSADVRNRLQLPLIGYLFLEPQVNWFIYHGKGVPETGSNLFLGLGLTYSRLWKPATESFVP